MSVAAWVDRLGGASGVERFRRYSLSSVGFFALFEAGLWAFWLPGRDAGTGWLALIAALGAAHVVVQVLLLRAALRGYLGVAPRPDGLIALYTALTLAMAAVGSWLLADGQLSDKDVGPLLLWLLMFYSGPVALALPVRTGAVLIAVVTVGSIGAAAACGLSGEPLAMVILVSALVVPFMAVAIRLSGWSVRLVEELAGARETQARLAVAEERLRFSRDLHDVLGSNLSVIALKSELAMQMARRGMNQAVDHMVEVQRIARESQREIRAVVRGYREADLHTELAGARSVLEAAGIGCRIQDGPAAELPKEVQAALGWVVREGTTNVLRHAADASRCEFTVRTPGAIAVLTMENDGATQAGEGTGSGLPGLRERLAELGGTLTTERRPGGLFRLTAEIPYEEEQEHVETPA